MNNTIDALLDRLRLLNESDPESDPQEIRPVTSTRNTIQTFARDIERPLSPMLKARFDYCGTWVDANVGQDFLDLDQIADFRNDPVLTESIRLRIENYENMPPCSEAPHNCAMFSYCPYSLDEVYLVWRDDAEEPMLWSYFGGDHKVFLNLQRYLEWYLGVRSDDDRAVIAGKFPDGFSPSVLT